MALFQIERNAVDAIVAPEARKVFRAHVNDALVARVVVENRGTRERARTVGRHQVERIVLPDMMATGETLRHENARLGVEPAHQLGSIAGKKLELAPRAANHGQGYFRITHRKLDLPKSIGDFDRWMLREKLERIRWKERVAAGFVPRGGDEKIGKQGVVDPRFDGFPK